MKYLSWNEQTVTDFSDAHVCGMYSQGYVFTRIGRGVMQQTRSARIDLAKFELSSENRRILKKTVDIDEPVPLELPDTDYDLAIGKLAKDFYEIKFGPGIMSAQKIKEMLTDPSKSNFNLMLMFMQESDSTDVGYSICFMNGPIVHYSYPFYDLKTAPKDMGLGMMIRAIEWAKAEGKKYIYLGSLQRITDSYKLQFAGLEWFDGGPDGSGSWSTDIEKAKEILKSAPTERFYGLRTLQT